MEIKAGKLLNSLSGVKLIITGIEGELIDSEQLHFDKWHKMASEVGILTHRDDFKDFWRKNLIGIGDRAIYEALEVLYKKQRYSPDAKFPSWDYVQKSNDKFYMGRIREAAIVEDMEGAIRTLREKGIGIAIVTHAPEALAKAQLKYIQEKSGISFEDKDIFLGEDKAKNAYPAAFLSINNFRRWRGLPEIKLEEVLVLDQSEKYLKHADKIGMKAAAIDIWLPKHLMNPHEKEEKTLLGWADIGRFLGAPVGGKPNPGPTPKNG